MLNQYTNIHNHRYWLVERQTRGQQNETSLQNVFTQAKERSGVNPYITLPNLRPSSANHLHESSFPLNKIFIRS